MAQALTHLEVYKLLPGTNCRDCGSPTCLAFAVAVAQGKVEPGACPELDTTASQSLAQLQKPLQTANNDLENRLNKLKKKAASMDIMSKADILGATAGEAGLTVPVLGKNFTVDSSGEISSMCHNNPWVTLPLLSYITGGKGVDPTGDWVRLPELAGGQDWARFFTHRCERNMQKLADEYTDLFKVLIDLFGGKPEDFGFQADVSIVLHPLPKLPILVCYWPDEEGLGSTLSLLFDRQAPENLPVEDIYNLSTGLLIMFQQIALTHGR